MNIESGSNIYSDWQDRTGISSLLQINADSWKNIAFPVINAIKLLVDA